MTPEQTQHLLDLLEQIAIHSQNFTITGAADWPLLVAMASILGMLLCILIAVIGFMWRDLRKSQRMDIDKLWKGMTDCQADCCPRGVLR